MADEPDFSLALEQGRSGLTLQQAQVDIARTRAVALLGAAGGGSVIAGVAVGTGGVPSKIAGGLAVLSFLLVSVSAYLVLRNRPLQLTVSPEVLVQWAETAGVTSVRMNKQLSLDLWTMYQDNRQVIDRMYHSLGLGLLAVLAEFVFVSVAFGLNLG